MAVDLISDLLGLIDARCVIAGGVQAGGDWSFAAPLDAPVKLEVILARDCWMTADDDPPLALGPGDVVVLNGVKHLGFSSDPRLSPQPTGTALRPTGGFFSQTGEGNAVQLIGGHVDLNPAGRQLFSAMLPAVLHVSAQRPEAGEMGQLLERISAEVTAQRPGAGFAVDQLAQLLLVQVLRLAATAETVPEPRRLALIADPQLRPALALMHDDPARPWRLEELAAAAAMSRSHFAQRFRDVAGQPPLAYLAQLRIALAQRALRSSDTTVAALADRLGYASESSFSRAFTRIAGTSPSGYRRDLTASGRSST